MNEITYKVVSVLANLSQYQDTRKKLCLVSWNNRPPKLDLRTWREGEDGKAIPGKGITFSDEEAEKIRKGIEYYLSGKAAGGQ